MKTIAEQMNAKKFPFKLFDTNNREVYSENSSGFWRKWEYDKNNNKIYFENSNGYWYKKEYDKNNKIIQWEDSTSSWFKQEFDESGNEIYYETSKGYWEKREYNQNNKQIYFENSNDDIIDDRPKSKLYLDYYINPCCEIKNIKLDFIVNIPKLIKEITMQDVEEQFGCTVKIIKETL